MRSVSANHWIRHPLYEVHTVMQIAGLLLGIKSNHPSASLRAGYDTEVTEKIL